MATTPVFLPAESHGQRSLADLQSMTRRSHCHFHSAFTPSLLSPLPPLLLNSGLAPAPAPPPAPRILGAPPLSSLLSSSRRVLPAPSRAPASFTVLLWTLNAFFDPAHNLTIMQVPGSSRLRLRGPLSPVPPARQGWNPNRPLAPPPVAASPGASICPLPPAPRVLRAQPQGGIDSRRGGWES